MLVSGAIRGLIEKRERTTSEETEPPSSATANITVRPETQAGRMDEVYNPVKYSSSHFTGREDYLETLASYFRPRARDDPLSRRELVLYGIGGVGKTQICLKFAELRSNMQVTVTSNLRE